MIKHLIKRDNELPSAPREMTFIRSLDGPFKVNKISVKYKWILNGYKWHLQGGFFDEVTENEIGMSLFFDPNLTDGAHELEIGDAVSKTTGHYYQFIHKEDRSDWLYFYPAESGSVSINFNRQEQIMTGVFKFKVKDTNDKERDIHGSFSIKGFNQILSA